MVLKWRLIKLAKGNGIYSTLQMSTKKKFGETIILEHAKMNPQAEKC